MTSDDDLHLLDAYLRAGGGEGRFPDGAAVVIRCKEHGTRCIGLFRTDIGPVVVTADAHPDAGQHSTVHRRKLPAGFKVRPYLLDEMSAGDSVGGWCPKGGRLIVTFDELMGSWSNRARRIVVDIAHR